MARSTGPALVGRCLTGIHHDGTARERWSLMCAAHSVAVAGTGEVIDGCCRLGRGPISRKLDRAEIPPLDRLPSGRRKSEGLGLTTETLVPMDAGSCTVRESGVRLYWFGVNVTGLVDDYAG